jgi:branched-chain amino acid transport system substrate-binding protein
MMVRRNLLAVCVVSIVALFASRAGAEILIGVAGPVTGAYAWYGEQFQRAAEAAVADLNANGGVLDQSVRAVLVDDYCDPEQAVAAANKLVADGVVFVVGHWCAHASIPASRVYEKAGILQISPSSASAKLTDEGGPNVFRVCGRDGRQGVMVGDYLAKHWAGREIAIVDDGTTRGAGVANALRRRLHERGEPVAVDEAYTPGELEYYALISKMRAAGVDVVFVGGYHREAGLILRHAHDRGYDLRLVANSAMGSEDFPLIAGPALEGTVMVAQADMCENPRAAARTGLRAAGAHAQRLRHRSGLGAGGSGGWLARPRRSAPGHAHPPVRHRARPNRLRRQGRRHRHRALGMVRPEGRQLRAARATELIDRGMATRSAGLQPSSA